MPTKCHSTCHLECLLNVTLLVTCFSGVLARGESPELLFQVSNLAVDYLTRFIRNVLQDFLGEETIEGWTCV